MRKFRQAIKMMVIALVMASALCSCSTVVLEEDPDAMQTKTKIEYVNTRVANSSTASVSEAF